MSASSAANPASPGSTADQHGGDPAGWRLEHTYSQLPPLFHAAAPPTPVRDPQLVLLNTALAGTLGLDAEVLRVTGAATLSGNALPENARPLAQAYAGHQFGHFTTLGDGRAILLGEHIDPHGRRWDVQLKGAGQTRYSRGGDGRAALAPMLREYVISEAMHALGIPTSRSLAVVATGEPVYRERALPGAVLTRIAASHIRVGTFEWAAGYGELALAALADYTRRRHYPDLDDADNPHLALLEAIVGRQAKLIAQWQHVGFVHGVMNTDNMALSGETLDYGPCAFVDAYDPATVFSSIDSHGRYAYGNQPAIAQWNLTRLAEAMLPLLDPRQEAAIEVATAVISGFKAQFEDAWLAGMRGKLGLFSAEAGDEALANGLLQWMAAAGADLTNTFRALSTDDGGAALADGDPTFAAWRQQWQARLVRQSQSEAAVRERMQAHNPAVIPRNHKVEAALTAAADNGDLSPTIALLDVLRTAYDYSRRDDAYGMPPAPGGPRYRTFCGT